MLATLCHHCDIIRTPDVISLVTIRLSIDDFLYVLLQSFAKCLACKLSSERSIN